MFWKSESLEIMLFSQWLIEQIWIGSKRQCFHKTVIKFHNIHRTAKLWTTVTICWNIWHWWNDGWSQLSEMSRLQFLSSVHLLCVCQPAWSNYLPIIPLQNVGLPDFPYLWTPSIQINGIHRDNYHTGLKSHITIPHICPFWYTAILFRPVKSTPKTTWILNVIAKIGQNGPK